MVAIYDADAGRFFTCEMAPGDRVNDSNEFVDITELPFVGRSAQS